MLVSKKVQDISAEFLMLKETRGKLSKEEYSRRINKLIEQLDNELLDDELITNEQSEMFSTILANLS